MKLTEFGRKVRHLRIDADVTLKDMADALRVSSAYLSAVEMGRKPVTQALAEGAADFLRERGIDPGDLVAVAMKAAKTVDVRKLETRDKALIAAFARRLPEMDEDRKRELTAFLED